MLITALKTRSKNGQRNNYNQRYQDSFSVIGRLLLIGRPNRQIIRNNIKDLNSIINQIDLIDILPNDYILFSTTHKYSSRQK